MRKYPFKSWIQGYRSKAGYLFFPSLDISMSQWTELRETWNVDANAESYNTNKWSLIHGICEMSFMMNKKWISELQNVIYKVFFSLLCVLSDMWTHAPLNDSDAKFSQWAFKSYVFKCFVQAHVYKLSQNNKEGMHKCRYDRNTSVSMKFNILWARWLGPHS